MTNTNCNNLPFAFNVQYFQTSNCASCTNGCGSHTADASCVIYTGSNLPCSGVNTGDNIEVAIQKIDERICSVTGDYSTYQLNCLPTWYEQTIITEAQFADAITGYACEISNNLSDFINITFFEYQTILNTRFIDIEVPGITCDVAGVTATDTLQDVLNKYCVEFDSISSNISLDAVDWSECFVVPTAPETVGEAFTLLISQICQINESSGALPTFNNSTSCIAGTSSDSLVATIGLIKSRLCSTPTFDQNNLSWGCISTPSFSDDQDITAAITALIDSVNTLIQATPTFDSGDFTVTAVGGPCDGLNIALATPSDQDRFVAANALDNSPGTLIDKLIGVGITVDDSTNPGQITLTSTATTDTYQVKGDITDTSPDYLADKLAGSTSNGISIAPIYNSGTELVDLNLNVSATQLFDYLLDALTPGSDLYAKFCEKVAGCPSPCDAPTNVQAIAGDTPVSTTTTTTTLP